MSLTLPFDNSDTSIIQLTLSESLTGETKISGLTFYLEFIYDQGNTVYAISLTDTSNYPIRYNEFQVTTSINLTGSTNIPFEHKGWYKYNAYNNLNGKLLEIGKCYIFDSEDNRTFFVKDEETKYVFKK